MSTVRPSNKFLLRPTAFGGGETNSQRPRDGHRRTTQGSYSIQTWRPQGRVSIGRRFEVARMMKGYNAVGYTIILAYALACMVFAPPHIGPWMGLLIGAAYFVTCWFIGGVYLSTVIHMGIAHRALDYKEWFVKTITVVNNTFGVYVNPVSWVNRHRLHHKFSDHPGDPNKLAADGFWRTLYLCLMPYTAKEDMAGDSIFKSRTFRVV